MCKNQGGGRSLIALLLAIAMNAAVPAATDAGEPSITVNSVAQRWPWNNKIDVTYTVTNGQDRAAGLYCGVEFTITDGGKSHVLHGYTVGASAEGDADGTTHAVVLTAPSGIRSANCTISATLFTTNVPSGNDYMIINLASGEIYYEGLMDTQDASNARYNVAEYKEGKMVLRKVPKWADHGDLPNADALTALGGYPTGHADYSTNNSRKYWQTAKDYYIGIFTVTQKQYTNLGKSNPSQMTKEKTGDMVAHRPVERLKWADLRSSIAPATALPVVTSLSGTFLQRLNYRTGNLHAFDLPTEAMFELAARAGATTVYTWGDDKEKVPDYCICASNYGGTTQGSDKTDGKGDYTCAVGSKLPNNWGIYDTAGNVWEWCRDGAGLANLGNATDPFVPHNTTGKKVGRSWGAATSAYTDESFRASKRWSGVDGPGWNRGFRVSHVVED